MLYNIINFDWDDELLEIFNIVPDKVARGIAKKAVVFGKRSQFDFPAMAKEVENRIKYYRAQKKTE